MITYIQVLNAVNRIHGWRDGIESSPLENQLAMSLRLYKDRKEFDGTMSSAYDCLVLAGYELNYEKESN